MSYSTILALRPRRLPVKIEELKNSHSTAPVIWEALSQKWLGGSWYNQTERLWPLHKDRRLPMHQRAVLMMTFDRARIAKEHFGRAASDIRKFLVDFPPKPGWVNHWARIAEILETNPAAHSVGIDCTSVNESLYVGDFDERRGRHKVIEWSRLFDVYAELDALIGEAE